MGIAKRVLLFLTVNVLVITTISIVISVLGIKPYLSAQGIDYSALLVFCALWGFGGAFISLGLSRIMAKMFMGVRVISENPGSAEQQWLVETVFRLAKSAGLNTMPQVGVYESPEVNAFATGPSRSRSLVAVSSGLLRGMNKGEIEGVLAHEVAHIANGDMVTMTLVQGVINSFVMFLSRVIAFALSQFVREEMRTMVTFAVTIVLDILLSILGSIAVAWFSRRREFRADQGGARLAGRQKMIDALARLQAGGLAAQPEGTKSPMAAFKISGQQGGLMALFATHPPLSVRIQKLKSMT